MAFVFLLIHPRAIAPEEPSRDQVMDKRTLAQVKKKWFCLHLFLVPTNGKGFQYYSLEVVVANLHSTSPYSCLLGLLRSPDIVLKYICSVNGKSTFVASVLMHLILQGNSTIIIHRRGAVGGAAHLTAGVFLNCHHIHARALLKWGSSARLEIK